MNCVKSRCLPKQVRRFQPADQLHPGINRPATGPTNRRSIQARACAGPSYSPSTVPERALSERPHCLCHACWLGCAPLARRSCRVATRRCTEAVATRENDLYERRAAASIYGTHSRRVYPAPASRRHCTTSALFCSNAWRSGGSYPGAGTLLTSAPAFKSRRTMARTFLSK